MWGLESFEGKKRALAHLYRHQCIRGNSVLEAKSCHSNSYSVALCPAEGGIAIGSRMRLSEG